MIDQTIDIATKDGAMETFITIPIAVAATPS
jgi:hypothetical protein